MWVIHSFGAFFNDCLNVMFDQDDYTKFLTEPKTLRITEKLGLSISRNDINNTFSVLFVKLDFKNLINFFLQKFFEPKWLHVST